MKRPLLWLMGMCFALRAAGPFEFRELNETSIQLLEAGKPVYVYNYGMTLKTGMAEDRRRACYLHPVWTPDGTVVTDDFPIDHPHHRGIFWAWPHVKIGDEDLDLWGIRGIHQKFVRWMEKKISREQARLGIENAWYAGDRKVVNETVLVVAQRAGGNRRALDFTLVFEALGEPVSLTGESANKKGYGGFNVRFAPRERTAILTDRGKEAVDSNMVPLPWAELAADYAGRHAAVRVEVAPGNPAYPNGWCLRHYGYLGVNFPGLTTYTLERGKPLRLSYRVIVSGANASE
jgi:hypothetical protein